MDRLSELQKNLLDMTQDERREYIRRIRADRRITKDRPATRVAKKVQSGKAKTKLNKMLDGLTPAQILALLGEKK